LKDDLERYIEKRKKASPGFAKDFESGYTDFRIAVVRRHPRKAEVLTRTSLSSAQAKLGKER
jgi:hypothetical protein